VLTSTDGATFRTFFAKAQQGDAGVVIATDVRGLHRFYEELAERFASANVHAIAFDYFGRTAGTAKRPDDFAFQEHATAARARPDLIQARRLRVDRGAPEADWRRARIRARLLHGRPGRVQRVRRAERRRRASSASTG